MTVTEEWRAIPGYEGVHDVSNLGRVRSLDRIDNRGRRLKGRVMKLTLTVYGYQRVVLSGRGKQRGYQVHRLVLMAFVGLPPTGTEACHYDGNRSNNRLENLRWDTKSGNARDKIRHGTHPETNKTHCPSGHEYAGDNVYWRPRGGRKCRECHRQHCRRYYWEKRTR